MTDDAIIHDRIMRRVARIRLLARIFHPAAVKAYGGLLLLAFALSVVSIADVVANMPTLIDLPGILHFLTNAILHTELSVQLALAALIGIIYFLLKDAFTALSHRPLRLV